METNRQVTQNETSAWYEVQIRNGRRWINLDQDGRTFDTREEAQEYANTEIIRDDIEYRITKRRGLPAP